MRRMALRACTAVRIVSLEQLRTRKGQQMAFAEVEDRIMRVEAVLFPTAWARLADVISVGGLAIVQAAVQQGDEDFKLIVDDLVPLDAADPALADGVQRLRRQARARSARAGARAAPAGRAAAGAAPAAAPARRAGAAHRRRPPCRLRRRGFARGAAPSTRRACGSAGVHQDRGGSGASRRAGAPQGAASGAFRPAGHRALL